MELTVDERHQQIVGDEKAEAQWYWNFQGEKVKIMYLLEGRGRSHRKNKLICTTESLIGSGFLEDGGAGEVKN